MSFTFEKTPHIKVCLLVKAGKATLNLTRLVEFEFSENLDSIF